MGTHHQIHDTNIAAATVIPFTILIGFLDIEEFEPKLSSIYLLDYIYLSIYLSIYLVSSGLQKLYSVGGNERAGAGYIRHHHCTCH